MNTTGPMQAGTAGGYPKTSPAGMSDMKPRETQVAWMLENLDGAATHLIAAVSLLGIRLEPVMRPEAPENACCGEPACDALVPVASRIGFNANEVHRLAARIESFVERMEV